MYNNPCSEFPRAYMGQAGPQFATGKKEHCSVIRRQDGNSLLAIHCVTISGWNGSTKRPREFIEAGNTTATCINQCTTISRATPRCESIRIALARNYKSSVALHHLAVVLSPIPTIYLLFPTPWQPHGKALPEGILIIKQLRRHERIF